MVFSALVLTLAAWSATIFASWLVLDHHKRERARLTMELADARAAEPNCRGCAVVAECRRQGEQLRQAWAMLDALQRGSRPRLVSDRFKEVRPS